MNVVLQRVRQAAVTVNSNCIGKIEQGVLLLVGIHRDDTPEQAAFLAEKCAQLRIFADDDNKMNRSLIDIRGAALVVSQFTLLGDCSRGRRPSFINAAQPERGRQLYEYFTAQLRTHINNVQQGEFGAHMEVSLVNDGPVTLLLER